MSNNNVPPIIDQFFRAMQAGATSEAEMMSLFSEDAVYTEPFSGKALTHEGREAIRQTFVQGWKYPLPDMRIEVERFQVEGKQFRVDWVCFSPALPGGRGKGTNVFEVDNGLIVSLVTALRSD